MTPGDDPLKDLTAYFANSPKPIVKAICVANGCGALVLAVFRYDGSDLVVVDMGDVPERVNKASVEAGFGGSGDRLPIEGPTVPGIGRPIFYNLDEQMLSPVARCREHGAVHVATSEIVDAVKAARSGKPQTLRVHPRPLNSM